jgi:hypothetical protein
MKKESVTAVMALALTACGQIEEQEDEALELERSESWSLYSPIAEEKEGVTDFWTKVVENLDDPDSGIPQEFSARRFIEKTDSDGELSIVCRQLTVIS